MMSAEEKMVASEEGYENGIGAMSAQARKAAREKGYENGLGAMSAEARMVARANEGHFLRMELPRSRRIFVGMACCQSQLNS